eukprot:m.12302 g.12302  ORF g.12302 m.12302 type:complete len:574 (+) comp5818_c0_seq1:180-1901(+)
MKKSKEKSPSEKKSGFSRLVSPFGKRSQSIKSRKDVSAQPPVQTAFTRFAEAPVTVKERRSSSSFFKSANPVALEHLPDIRSAKEGARTQVVLDKLDQCCHTFDFTDPTSDIKSKEVKRRALIDLLQSLGHIPQLLNLDILKKTFQVFEINCLRPIPPPSVCNGAEFDAEEDEPALEPAFPHLELIYNLMIQVLQDDRIRDTAFLKLLKGLLTTKFLYKFIAHFHLEDPRERDFLKTILHRLYGLVIPARAKTRHIFRMTFISFVLETDMKFNGIAELLEVYGSVVQGLSPPLKSEHVTFCLEALMPLHKPACLCLFHPQLTFCLVHLVRKDATIFKPIVQSLLRFWPVTNSSKQVLFIAELEDIMSNVSPSVFAEVSDPVIKRLSRCLNDPHFQVAERALYFVKSPDFIALIGKDSKRIITRLIPALLKASEKHWHGNIPILVQDAVRQLSAINESAVQFSLTETKDEQQQVQVAREQREKAWETIVAKAKANPVSDEYREAAVARRRRRSTAIDLQAALDHLSTDNTESSHSPAAAAERASLMRRKSLLPVDRFTQLELASYQPHNLLETS